MVLVAILVVLAWMRRVPWYWGSNDLKIASARWPPWAWCQAAVALSIAGRSSWLQAGSAADPAANDGSVSSAWSPSPPVRVLGGPGGVLPNWLRMQRRPWAATGYNVGFFLGNVALTILCVVVLRLGIAGVFIAQAVVMAA